jgi:uncharacterized protein
LLRPEAVAVLRGADLIVHAGDVGKPEVLAALRVIAPTIAVRGNNDTGAWARGLRLAEIVQAGALRLYVVHEVARLRVDPAADGIAAVISGHSHRPHAERRDGVLYLNPGSAGPRRFSLPVAVGTLRIAGRTLRHEIVELAV